MTSRFCALWDRALDAACRAQDMKLKELARALGMADYRTLSQSRYDGPSRKRVGLATVQRVAEMAGLPGSERHALSWAWFLDRAQTEAVRGDAAKNAHFWRMVLALLDEYERLAPGEQVAILQRTLLDLYPMDDKTPRGNGGRPRARK